MTKTVSETLFENFLLANNLSFQPIPTGISQTPDYEVTIGGTKLIFEVKELAEGIIHHRTVGDAIRKKNLRPAHKKADSIRS